jgi:hypothetical protein
MHFLEMDNEELKMFLMMFWKRQVPRGTKCGLKNQNYVIRMNWKNLHNYARMKTSE